jgi:hypothetical protein
VRWLLPGVVPETRHKHECTKPKPETRAINLRQRFRHSGFGIRSGFQVLCFEFSDGAAGGVSLARCLLKTTIASGARVIDNVWSNFP